MDPLIDLPEADCPHVVALEMGYGHLRPATALAQALGVPLEVCDRAPMASEEEIKVWRQGRNFYEWSTRTSAIPGIGRLVRPIVRRMTQIEPLYPLRDLSKATWPVRHLEKLLRKGLCTGLIDTLRRTGRPLLTTYFACAHAADKAGLDRIFLVVTDSDVHRVWAPPPDRNSRIDYLVPSARVARRLEAYGVAPERIHRTGFPLPHGLVGGPARPVLKAHLARRLVRLDPEGRYRDALGASIEQDLGPLPTDAEGKPAHLVFAVGGAGAQTELIARALPSLRTLLDEERIRLTLVAGVRDDAHARLRGALEKTRLADHPGIDVLHEVEHAAYFRRFEALMAETDILWTKPSELTFFGALGLALLLAPPLGEHERFNRRWARERGAGLAQRRSWKAGHWIGEWLEDGLFAASAFTAARHLPGQGLYRTIDHLATRLR